MKHMMFVYTADEPEAGMHEQIALLPNIEMVYDFFGHGDAAGWECPDFVVVVRHSNDDNNVGLYEAIGAISPGVRIHMNTIWHEQPHIIGVEDIPGGPVVPPAKLKAAPRPVITTEDIPGYVRSPSMRPALVHHDFSSQAGLAGFAGIGGMQHLAGLGD